MHVSAQWLNGKKKNENLGPKLGFGMSGNNDFLNLANRDWTESFSQDWLIGHYVSVDVSGGQGSVVGCITTIQESHFPCLLPSSAKLRLCCRPTSLPFPGRTPSICKGRDSSWDNSGGTPEWHSENEGNVLRFTWNLGTDRKERRGRGKSKMGGLEV